MYKAIFYMQFIQTMLKQQVYEVLTKGFLQILVQVYELIFFGVVYLGFPPCINLSTIMFYS